MKKKITILLLIVAGACFIKATDKYFAKPKPVNFVVPKGWPDPVYDFSKNQLTEEGFELGKKLFYDERLSKDGTVSCGSCHQQFAAFTTFDHPFSHGIENTFTTRNAPALFNLAWKKEFMYDGAILHLDAQPLAPLTAANEMGETIENVISKIESDTAYRRMFKAAFGSNKITTAKVTKALSQFMLMLVSSNSKYDKVIRGEAQFSKIEQRGYELFKEKNCATCHPEPLFTDFSYRNTGLPVDSFLNDFGRMRIVDDRADSLKFMVPSLRNLRLTFPYGHDGRFYSAQDAIAHYNSKVQAGPTTDPLLANGIPMTNMEISAIKSFLFSLTDTSLVKDPRFFPPVRKVDVDETGHQHVPVRNK